MRYRVAVLFVVLATVAQIGAFAPSAGAAGGESCAQLVGRAKFNPPLPPVGTNTKVVTTISSDIGLNFNECSKPGGAYGKFAFKAKAKAARNCQTLGAGLTAVGTGTIKWQKGTPSTLTALTFVIPQRSSTLKASVTASVSKGQFAGKHLKMTVVFAPANNSCQPPNGLSLAQISFPKGTKLLIS